MGLLTPYRGALATPGAPAFAAAGLLARLPLSMNGLALVLLAQGLTRNWAAAGAVAATYALAQALVSPLLSRLVDRHGQARVALPALAVHAAALLAVLLIAATGAHLLLLGLAAALAGAAFVSWGSLVRARWAHALRGPDGARHLHPAFSLESVLDEVVFTVGPPVATLLAVAVSPSVALGAALASTVAGGVALLAQRRTEPPPHRADPAAEGAEGAEGAEVSGGGAPAGLRARVGRAVGALRVPGLRALALTFVATGAVFGSVEVIAVAFTAERGVPGAAGVVLALYSVGSLVAGVAFGAVTWRGSLPRRFRLGAVGMAVLIAPVALAGSVPVLAATLFLSGLAISPTLISGNALVAELVAPRQLTEGLAWVGTALGVGVSLGAAASGPLIEGPGPRTALLLPVVCAAAAALVVLACSRVLGVPPRRSPDNGTGRGRGRLSR